MYQPYTENILERQTSSGICLTPEDVDRLLHDSSADSRIGVLEKISHQYDKKQFQQREFLIAEEIFRILMKDTEQRVREILSQHVKDNPDIPRDVILHLAQDVEKVAISVLESSVVLSDADLIQIIQTSREMNKLLAISRRDRVSERVSQALVETHYPQVVESLLKNEGATISDESFEAIIKECSYEENVTAALVERGGLPLFIVEKLIHHVSDSIAEALKQQYDLSEEDIRQHAEGTREALSLTLLKDVRDDDAIVAMVIQMREQGRLTPSVVLQGLCRGYLRFFEIALAELADIPVANARTLISDRGELGFKALYEKTQLPESTFEAVRLVLDAIRNTAGENIEPDTPSYANYVVGHVLEMAEGREVDNLPYIIALIRQNNA